jgi:hypothetical protein
VSSTSINVAEMTVAAMSQGLIGAMGRTYAAAVLIRLGAIVPDARTQFSEVDHDAQRKRNQKA